MRQVRRPGGCQDPEIPVSQPQTSPQRDPESGPWTFCCHVQDNHQMRPPIEALNDA